MFWNWILLPSKNFFFFAVTFGAVPLLIGNLSDDMVASADLA